MKNEAWPRPGAKVVVFGSRLRSFFSAELKFSGCAKVSLVPCMPAIWCEKVGFAPRQSGKKPREAGERDKRVTGDIVLLTRVNLCVAGFARRFLKKSFWRKVAAKGF